MCLQCPDSIAMPLSESGFIAILDKNQLERVNTVCWFYRAAVAKHWYIDLLSHNRQYPFWSWTYRFKHGWKISFAVVFRTVLVNPWVYQCVCLHVWSSGQHRKYCGPHAAKYDNVNKHHSYVVGSCRPLYDAGLLSICYALLYIQRPGLTISWHPGIWLDYLPTVSC